MAVSKVKYGSNTLIDLTSDTVKPDKLAAGITAHDAAGNLITGLLEIVTPKINFDKGVMYAPGAAAYYTPVTISDYSINFNYFGASGCEQILFPITGLSPGCTYTIEFTETYNGGFISDSYQYGCGIMQEADYNSVTFPINSGKLSWVTWTIATVGTHGGTLTFTANTSKVYWLWNMAQCNDNTKHNITFTAKPKANGLSLQDKTVTENGVVTSDNGYDALGSVTVNVTPEEVTLQTKNINMVENGTLTVAPDDGYDGLASVNVTVDVAGSEDTSNEDAVVTRNFTSYTNPRILIVPDYGFYYHQNLQSVNLPAVTSIGYQSFLGCNSLTSVYIPSALTINSNAFSSCSSITMLDFPQLQTIKNTAFANCTKLKAFILRGSTVCTISNNTGFYGTPINGTSGYIYVPSALIDSYKTATNWSTHASQFRALEDYTVDSTVTGALDESKI